MSSKTLKPKTGLASRMRDWMCGRSRFTAGQIYDAFALAPGRDRAIAFNALRDFIRRGEVVPLGVDRRLKPPVERYGYNPAWQKVNKGVLNKKIFKAMYVAGRFTVCDVLRLAGAGDRSYIDRITKRLVDQGHVSRAGRRACAHGAGAEYIYILTDRDRFRLEVMR